MQIIWGTANKTIKYNCYSITPVAEPFLQIVVFFIFCPFLPAGTYFALSRNSINLSLTLVK